MSKYEFKYNKENGYRKLKISRKSHKKLLPNRRLNPFIKYEYLSNDEQVVILKLPTALGLVYLAVMYIPCMIIYGLANAKETHGEMMGIFFAKKSGRFTADNVRKNSDLFEKIMKESKA